MSEDIRIEIECDSTQVKVAEADAKARLKEITVESSQTKQEVAQTVTQSKSQLENVKQLAKITKSVTRLTAVSIAGMFYQVVNSIRSVLSAAGVSLGAVGEAIVSSVVSTVSSLTAISAAWSSGGYTAWLGAIVGGAAITLSIMGNLFAAKQQQETSAQMNAANAAMSSAFQAIATGMQVL